MQTRMAEFLEEEFGPAPLDIDELLLKPYEPEQ